MARIVKGTGVEFPELKKIRQMLGGYTKSIRNKYMKAAFTAAAKAALPSLRQATPRGPTGNLKRSIKSKSTKNYGLAGYALEKGPHQGFLEFGTKARKTKSGRIASTMRSKTAGRGGMMTIVQRGGKVVTKSPNYPKSFFKSAPAGSYVDLKRMPIGGRTGKPPVKSAFQSARGQITSVLRQQMSTVLERANKDMARVAPPR